MPYTRKQLPKYCRHKPTGQAFVRIGGKMHYLGKFGSQASRHEYDRLIAEFVANGRQPTQHTDEILVEQLLVRFAAYADKERSYHEITKMRITAVLRLVNGIYGKTLVSEFSPKALKSIRQQFLERGLSRNTINKYVSIIKQVFYWGCEEEIVPAEIAGGKGDRVI